MYGISVIAYDVARSSLKERGIFYRRQRKPSGQTLKVSLLVTVSIKIHVHLLHTQSVNHTKHTRPLGSPACPQVGVETTHLNAASLKTATSVVATYHWKGATESMDCCSERGGDLPQFAAAC